MKILHRNQLSDFKNYLNFRNLPTKGNWEVCRWSIGKGSPMAIIYDNYQSCEHLSCNRASVPDIRAFINKNKKLNLNS